MKSNALYKITGTYYKLAQTVEHTDSFYQKLKAENLLSPEVMNRPETSAMIQEAATNGMPQKGPSGQPTFDIGFGVNNGKVTFKTNPPDKALLQAAYNNFGPLIQNLSAGESNFVLNNWIKGIFWESE